MSTLLEKAQQSVIEQWDKESGKVTAYISDRIMEAAQKGKTYARGWAPTAIKELEVSSDIFLATLAKMEIEENFKIEYPSKFFPRYRISWQIKRTETPEKVEFTNN